MSDHPNPNQDAATPSSTPIEVIRAQRLARLANAGRIPTSSTQSSTSPSQSRPSSTAVKAPAAKSPPPTSTPAPKDTLPPQQIPSSLSKQSDGPPGLPASPSSPVAPTPVSESIELLLPSHDIPNWQHLLDEWTHEAIRHILGVTTDIDIYSTFLRGNKPTPHHLPSSLSDHVHQAHSTFDWEQRVGYIYLPLISKVILGEFVANVSSSASIELDPNTDKNAGLPMQSLKTKNRPYLSVSHMDSIFREIHSLMTGYSQIPLELIQPKAVLSDPPTLELCFETLSSIVYNSHRTAPPPHETQQDGQTSAARTISLNYHQQAAMLVGALATEALMSPSPDNVATVPSNDAPSSPSLQPQGGAPASHASHTSSSKDGAIKPLEEMLSAPKKKSLFRLFGNDKPHDFSVNQQTLDTLLSTIEIPATLALSAVLPTMSHVVYNVHNSILRSRSMFYYLIQCYQRVQTLYEYISSLANIHTLGGISIQPLIQKVNSYIESMQQDMNDDIRPDLRRSDASKTIDISQIHTPAFGSCGDLLSVNNFIYDRHHRSHPVESAQRHTKITLECDEKSTQPLDAISTTAYTLLGIDSHVSMHTLLAHIANSRLLTNMDYIPSGSSLAGELSSKYMTVTPTKNQGSMANIGYSHNSLYSRLQQPGNTIMDQLLRLSNSDDTYFTMNSEASKGYFSSLICPLVQPLSAAVVSHGYGSSLTTHPPLQSSHAICEVVDPVPIFALVHSLIPQNATIQAATIKGSIDLPIVMMIPTLLATLSTISSRILAAAGSLLTFESHDAINVIHKHYLDEAMAHSQLVPELKLASKPKKISPECLPALHRTSPSFAYLIQALQAESTTLSSNFWSYERRSAMSAASKMPDFLKHLPGAPLPLGQNPFSRVADMSHDWSYTLGLLAAMGISKQTITSGSPPLSFQCYFSYSLTRPISLSKTVALQQFSLSTTAVSSPPTTSSNPIVTTLDARLPTQTASIHCSTLPHVAHNIRRRVPHLREAPSLSPEQHNLLVSIPYVSQSLLGMADENEYESTTVTVQTGHPITVGTRSHYQSHLLSQRYRYSHQYALHTLYGDEFISHPPASSKKAGMPIVLHGCPIEILSLPSGFVHGILDVLEGGLHKVSGTHFDTDFISSIYAVNWGPEPRQEAISYPVSRTRYGRSNGSTCLSGTPDRSPVSPPQSPQSSPLTAPGSTPNQRYSANVPAFIRTYNSYRRQVDSTINKERGSVILAHVLYPLFSYFTLALQAAQSKREVLDILHLPMDIIDGCDEYECTYNWISSQNVLYASRESLLIDREIERKRASSVVQSTQVSHDNLSQVLSSLGISKSVLTLYLHELERDRYDPTKIFSRLTSSSIKQKTQEILGPHVKMVSGRHSIGYEALPCPGFIICGLSSLDSKKTESQSTQAQSYQGSTDSATPTSGGGVSLQDYVKQQKRQSSLTSTSSSTLPSDTTSSNDIVHPPLSQTSAAPSTTSRIMSEISDFKNSIFQSKKQSPYSNHPHPFLSLLGNMLDQGQLLTMGAPSPTLASPMPFYAVAKPISITLASCFLRGILNILTTPSSVALLLAHPGFAAMYNATALPNRDVSQRVIQWVHLKRQIDLQNLQSYILYPLTNPTQLLEKAPPPATSSPSISRTKGIDDDILIPSLSLSSILALPSMLRNTLGDFQLPKAKSLNLTEVVSAAINKTRDTLSLSSSGVSNPSSPQASAGSAMDYILPFFAQANPKTSAPEAYPVSITASASAGKPFSARSLFGTLLAVCPRVCDSAFLNLGSRPFSQVHTTFNRLRTGLSDYISAVSSLFTVILRTSPQARRRWLDYISTFLYFSSDFRKMNPDPTKLPNIATLTNLCLTLLTSVQPIIRVQPQPVELTLHHALLELGYTPPPNDLIASTNSSNDQQHESSIIVDITSFWPGKIELDYALRFDDVPSTFRLKLPPHIYAHVKRHLSPLSIEDISAMNDLGDAQANGRQRSSSFTFHKLLTASAQGIVHMTNRFLPLMEARPSPESLPDIHQTPSVNPGSSVNPNEHAEVSPKAQPQPQQASTIAKPNTTYLSMMYTHITDLLNALSFFMDNSCRCDTKQTKIPFAPTPCHSAKAMQSLATSPWILPNEINLNAVNADISPILSQDNNVLALIQKQQQRQQYNEDAIHRTYFDNNGRFSLDTIDELDDAEAAPSLQQMTSTSPDEDDDEELYRTAMYTQRTLRSLPKFAIQITDICSQCGLLLNTTDTSKVSRTLNTLFAIQARLRKVLSLSPALAAVRSSPRSKIILQSPPVTTPREVISNALTQVFGREAFTAAMEYGLWMLLGNTTDGTKHPSHLFNVVIHNDEEDDNISMDENLDFTKIHSIEASETVTVNGQQTEVEFTTYLVPMSLVLQVMMLERSATIINLADEPCEGLNIITNTKVSQPPFVFCHDLSKITDIDETGSDIDPSAVSGLISLYLQADRSAQREVFLSLMQSKEGNDSKCQPTYPSAQGSHGGKSSQSLEFDSDTMYARPGSQYGHCSAMPPYNMLPTRYIRYSDQDRLFYHSSNQVNSVYQQYADKLFMAASLKTHHLTAMQLKNSQEILPTDRHDELYDSLYSYNLMVYLSHYFSEKTLISALDNDKDIEMQSIATASPSIASNLYGFRTEALCQTLEALHLTLPTLTRSLEDSEDRIRQMRDIKLHLVEEEKKLHSMLNELKAKLPQASQGGDLSMLMRLRGQIEILEAETRRFAIQSSRIDDEILSLNGHFGRTKMIVTDPNFIHRTLTLYNWVCSLVLACTHSSCIYCRCTETATSTKSTLPLSTAQSVRGNQQSDMEKLLAQIYTCTCSRTIVGCLPQYWVEDIWQWINCLNNIHDPTLRVICQTNTLDSVLALATTSVKYSSTVMMQNPQLEGIAAIISHHKQTATPAVQHMASAVSTYSPSSSLPVVSISANELRQEIAKLGGVTYESTPSLELIIGQTGFELEPVQDGQLEIPMDPDMVKFVEKTTMSEQLSYLTSSYNNIDLYQSIGLSPLAILLGSHLSNFSHTGLAEDDMNDKDDNAHVIRCINIMQTHLHHMEPTSGEPAMSQISSFHAIEGLSLESDLPSMPRASIRSQLRQPLQVYLASVLNTFIPDERRHMTQSVEITSKITEAAFVTRNRYYHPRSLLGTFPYSKPSDVAKILDSAVASIGIDVGTKLTTVTPGKDDRQVSFPPFNIMSDPSSHTTESYKTYNTRFIQQLPQDKEGYLSPQGISWWPLRYIHLDTTVHPLWRNGRQSAELIPLLLALYAKTAEHADTSVVENEAERQMLTIALREKHGLKYKLTQLFITLLLTEEEEEAGQQAIDERDVILTVNRTVLEYEISRQVAVRKAVIWYYEQQLAHASNPQHQGAMDDSDSHRTALETTVAAFTSGNTPAESTSLSNIIRDDNLECSCGCSCFGCGCGFNTKTYHHLHVPSHLAMIHVPPPQIYCICGQHTKSLSRLAKSNPINAVSHEQTVATAIQTVIVNKYNNAIDSTQHEDAKSLALKRVYIPEVLINFPLFDHFIHVLCDDIILYLDEMISGLKEMKIRETNPISPRFNQISDDDNQDDPASDQEDGDNDDARQRQGSTRPMSDRALFEHTGSYCFHANAALQLLSVICLRGKSSLLRPEFTSRIALIVGSYLHRFTDSSEIRSIGVAQPQRLRLNFIPKYLIQLLTSILTSLATIPSLPIQQLSSRSLVIKHPLGSLKSIRTYIDKIRTNGITLGGLSFIKALTQRDANFSVSDLTSSSTVLVKSGSAVPLTSLEQAILNDSAQVVFAATYTDLTRKTDAHTSPTGLAIYGPTNDDKARAITRCQARAVGALRLYQSVHALTLQPGCTAVSGWEWIYSSHHIRTIADTLYKYGTSVSSQQASSILDENPETITPDNLHEIALGWWPLPPLSAPILAALMGALKGECEWDTHLTWRHFLANKSTVTKLRIDDLQQMNTLSSTVNNPCSLLQLSQLQLTQYAYYTRPLNLSSEFWFRRISLMFNVFSSNSNRYEALFEEVPDEFNDDCFWDFMLTPIVLPSNGKIEWLSMYRSLMTSDQDPFTRAPLTAEKLTPLVDIQYAIQLYRAAKGYFE